MEYTVKQLHEGAIDAITEEGGLYIVKMPKGYRFSINEKNYGRQYTSKGKKSEYRFERLKSKIDRVYGDEETYKSDILYIGQSGHSVGIRERLNEYLAYRYDEPGRPHNGGRALWQLNGNESFIVEVRPMKADEDPEKIEHRMLLDYKAKYGDYPFANWRS